MAVSLDPEGNIVLIFFLLRYSYEVALHICIPALFNIFMTRQQNTSYMPVFTINS